MHERTSIYYLCFDDPDRLADFWEAALDGARLDLPPSNDPVIVEPPDGQPNLLFKDLPCASRNDLAIHLDLEVEDRAAGVERLEELGPPSARQKWRTSTAKLRPGRCWRIRRVTDFA